MRFAFRWGIYGAWPALSKAAPSVLLQTVYLVPRMKMRQHRAIMAYCMRCKFLLCAFYLSWAKGEAARRLAVPPWLRACGRRRGRTVSPVWESENSRLSSAQDGALTFIWRAAGCGQSRARLRHARAPACRAARPCAASAGFGLISLAPCPHGVQNRLQALPQFCQAVFHPRRHLCVHMAADKALFFHIPKLCGQHLLRHAANRFF